MQTTNTHVQKGDDITNSSTLNHCTAAVVFCSIWQTIQFLSVVWPDTYLYLDKYLVLLLKEVAFIAGKSENQAAKKNFIRFFIDNLIANIKLYALT